MIVLDASATLDGFCNDECWPSLVSLFKTKTIIVPQHYQVECLNGLRRIDRVQPLSLQELSSFKYLIECLPFLVVPTEKVSHSIWRHRHNMTAYDAHYVVIAEANNIPLVTHDEKLAKYARQFVEVLRLD